MPFQLRAVEKSLWAIFPQTPNVSLLLIFGNVKTWRCCTFVTLFSYQCFQPPAQSTLIFHIHNIWKNAPISYSTLSIFVWNEFAGLKLKWNGWKWWHAPLRKILILVDYSQEISGGMMRLSGKLSIKSQGRKVLNCKSPYSNILFSPKTDGSKFPRCWNAVLVPHPPPTHSSVDQRFSLNEWVHFTSVVGQKWYRPWESKYQSLGLDAKLR